MLSLETRPNSFCSQTHKHESLLSRGSRVISICLAKFAPLFLSLQISQVYFHFYQGTKTTTTMCKVESRWESLKRGVTLHLSMLLEKVNLLNLFS